MPIRFRCPHCQKRLSIGTHKSGVSIDCPTCRERVLVPHESEVITIKGRASAIELSPSEDAPAGQGVPPLADLSSEYRIAPVEGSVNAPVDAPMIIAADDDVPSPEDSGVTYIDATLAPNPSAPNTATPQPMASIATSPPRDLPRPSPHEKPWPEQLTSKWRETFPRLDESRVTVPRYVVYSQGLLLGAIAVICLFIGFFFGRASSPNTAPIDPATLPCIVTGKVEYEDSQGARRPDFGAVILALPAAEKPDKQIDSAGLGVDDPQPKADHPGVRALEAIGGKIVRVGPTGRYEFSVPRGGTFYVVAISKQARRGTGLHQPSITSKIGEYITPQTKLLGQQQYQMQTPILRERRTVDFSFKHADL